MDKVAIKDSSNADVVRNTDHKETLGMRGTIFVEARNAGGELIWDDTIYNTVTDEGKNYLLDTVLTGGTQISTWFLVPITGTTPTVSATDTMAAHAGWTENQDYDEAARQGWTGGTVATQSVDNNASPAVITINAGVTIGGVAMASDATKGGTIGTLLSGGAFSNGDKILSASDTLTMRYTFTA